MFEDGHGIPDAVPSALIRPWLSTLSLRRRTKVLASVPTPPCRATGVEGLSVGQESAPRRPPHKMLPRRGRNPLHRRRSCVPARTILSRDRLDGPASPADRGSKFPLTPGSAFQYNPDVRSENEQANTGRKTRGVLSVLTPGDLIVMGVIFAVSSVGLYLVTFRGHTGGTCVVEVEGKKVYELPLSEERDLAVSGPLGETVIKVEDGSVWVVDSPCPLKLCVKTGRIARTNEMIVCLPNKVVVTIEGGRGEVDGVTW